jgi:hypothetical protein
MSQLKAEPSKKEGAIKPVVPVDLKNPTGFAVVKPVKISATEDQKVDRPKTLIIHKHTQLGCIPDCQKVLAIHPNQSHGSEIEYKNVCKRVVKKDTKVEFGFRENKKTRGFPKMGRGAMYGNYFQNTAWKNNRNLVVNLPKYNTEDSSRVTTIYPLFTTIYPIDPHDQKRNPNHPHYYPYP